MSWPDVEVILAETFSDLGETYLRLPVEWMQPFEHADIDGPPAPVIHIYAIGGSRNTDILRQTRLIIDVFTASRDESREVSLTIRDRVTMGPLHTEAGLIDNMAAEVEPILMPFTHDRIIQFRATYRADTRPNPRPL